MKKKGFKIVCLLLLIKFNLNSSEELLDLTCQDSTHCKQYELDGIAVSCEDGLCHCWKSNNQNNNNNNNDSAQPQQNISKGQTIECRPKDNIKSNIIGGSCPCTIHFAECNEEQHVCYCGQDFVASLDRRRCLKESVPLGDACETDKQCAFADVYAVCDPTKLICQCGPGFVEYNGTCFSTVGDPALECPKATQCAVYGTGAFCSSTHNKCLCLEDYISVAEKLNCIPVSGFKEPCSEATQCVRKLGTGATCYGGRCNCDATHFVQPRQLPNGTEWTTCEPKVVLGKYCRTQNDCYQHHLSRSSQSMQCSYAECNCRIGFNNAIEKNSCTPDNFTPLQSAAVARLDYFKWSVCVLVNFIVSLWILF